MSTTILPDAFFSIRTLQSGRDKKIRILTAPSIRLLPIDSIYRVVVSFTEMLTGPGPLSLARLRPCAHKLTRIELNP